MISYSTNWMGPVSLVWTLKHGDHWSTGRIDVYGTNSEYPKEYTLPIMHSNDWINLTGWLDTLKTEEVLPYEELIEQFEKVHGKITWWQSDV
jgi:hypothetical protein